MEDRLGASVSVGAVPVVLVPRERFERWVANFAGRHGGTADWWPRPAGSSGWARTGPRSTRGCRSTCRTTASRRRRRSPTRSRFRTTGGCCWSARAASRWPGWRGSGWWSRRSASGTCRGGPRPAGRASSGSPDAGTTRRGRPTRRPRTMPPGSSAGHATAGGRRRPCRGRGGAGGPAVAPRRRGRAVAAGAGPRRGVLEQAVRDAGSAAVEVLNAGTGHRAWPDWPARPGRSPRGGATGAATSASVRAMWQPEPGWHPLPGGTGTSTVGVWRTVLGGRPVVVKRLAPPGRARPGRAERPAALRLLAARRRRRHRAGRRSTRRPGCARPG